jgi:hypothetical protein
MTHVERWATILAAVAMRLLRLTYLARMKPDLPPTADLTKMEATALIVEKRGGAYRLDDPKSPSRLPRDGLPSSADYVGEKLSGGPPGTTVLARGLRRLEDLARAVAKVLDFVG